MNFNHDPYAEELRAQLSFKQCSDKVVLCMNTLKSALILYYRACRTSQAGDWFEACIVFKRFQYSFQAMSFWDQIKFCIRLWEVNESAIAETQK